MTRTAPAVLCAALSCAATMATMDRVRVACDSRAAAQALLADRALDSGDTGGLQDLGGGAWALDVVVASRDIPALRRRPGVISVTVLQDTEANRRQRLRELQGKPAF